MVIIVILNQHCLTGTRLNLVSRKSLFLVTKFNWFSTLFYEMAEKRTFISGTTKRLFLQSGLVIALYLKFDPKKIVIVIYILIKPSRIKISLFTKLNEVSEKIICLDCTDCSWLPFQKG